MPESHLIGPNRRRIFRVEPESTRMRTVENLIRLGWVPYDGPAVTDEAGWIIDGTLEPA
jgi:hypothetical protein